MYFKNFPRTNYLYYDKNQKVQGKIAINITSRMKILDYVRDYRVNFDRYVIKDGERPDVLSDKLYERPDLHWMFFLVNDMMNPYESWPMSQKDLNDYIDEKYVGSSLFVPAIWKTSFSTDSNLSDYQFKILDGFDIKDVTESMITSKFFNISTISSSQLQKISIGSSVKVLINGSLHDSQILGLNPEFFEVYVTKKNWNFSGNQNFLVYQIDNFGQKRCVRVPITRVVNERRYSVHEFRVGDEYRDPSQNFEVGSSPYSTEKVYDFFVHPQTSEQINNGFFANSSFDSSSRSFSEVYSIADTDGGYLNPSFYVTNEDHELELNERKRSILVPRPSLINSVIRSMKDIFSNTSGDSRA